MFCTKCGKEIKDGSAFCTNCGAKVGAAPAQQQETPRPAVPSAAGSFDFKKTAGEAAGAAKAILGNIGQGAGVMIASVLVLFLGIFYPLFTAFRVTGSTFIGSIEIRTSMFYKLTGISGFGGELNRSEVSEMLRDYGFPDLSGFVTFFIILFIAATVLAVMPIINKKYRSRLFYIVGIVAEILEFLAFNLLFFIWTMAYSDRAGLTSGLTFGGGFYYVYFIVSLILLFAACGKVKKPKQVQPPVYPFNPNYPNYPGNPGNPGM